MKKNNLSLVITALIILIFVAIMGGKFAGLGFNILPIVFVLFIVILITYFTQKPKKKKEDNSNGAFTSTEVNEDGTPIVKKTSTFYRGGEFMNKAPKGAKIFGIVFGVIWTLMALSFFGAFFSNIGFIGMGSFGYVPIFMCILFVFVGVSIIIGSIKSLKNKNDNLDEAFTNITKKEKAEIERCPYCGRYLEKNQFICPSCGASVNKDDKDKDK